MPKFTSNFGQFLNQNFMGILYFASGMFLFAAVDTIAKVLTESFHPVQVAWSRQLGLLFGILIVLYSTHSKTRRFCSEMMRKLSVT